MRGRRGVWAGADVRFQSTAAVGRRALNRPFSKAVAVDLEALFGTRCEPYLGRSINRIGATDPDRLFGKRHGVRICSSQSER